MMRRLFLATVITVCLLPRGGDAVSSDHRYKAGEHVELWVNKVCLCVFAVFVSFVWSAN
jgi:hypothetical protein